MDIQQSNCTFVFGTISCSRPSNNQNGLCSLHSTLIELQRRLESSLRNRIPPIQVKSNEIFALVSFLLVLAKNRRDGSGEDVIRQLRQNPIVDELVVQFEKIAIELDGEKFMLFEDELSQASSEERIRKTEK